MQVLSSLSGITFYAPSAGFAPTNGADVSAIASAYQVVSATATQLYAGTNYVTSINETTISASRAGRAGNATLATSAYYDTNSRFISALPDSAAVSSIASAYAESAASSKQDTLAFAYNTADQISSINGSALAGQGGGIDSATCSAIASAYAESAASSKLDASASSSFYTTANESGFLTGVDLSPYQTTADMSSYIPTSMSSDFQQVTGMSSYALSSDVSATVDLVGTQSANWGGSALALSAGPGVKLEKSGNTLVASTDEMVLFSGQTATTATMNLNEAYTNFEYIDLIGHWDYNGTDRMCAYNRIPTSASIFSLGGIGIGNTAANSYDMFMCANEYSSNGTSVAVRKVIRINLQTTLSSNSDGIIVDKIIGINRTAEA